MKTPHYIKIIISILLVGGAVWFYQNSGEILGLGAVIPANSTPELEAIESWKTKKPVTDAQWAEDVKQESFHIKSTEKLQEMRTVHAEKLTRVQEGKREVFECRACIDFKYKESNPTATQVEIDAHYADELAKATWEVEKLKQSIERMDNELRLRENGFVVPDKNIKGEKTKQADLDKVSASNVRHIND